MDLDYAHMLVTWFCGWLNLYYLVGRGICDMHVPFVWTYWCNSFGQYIPCYIHMGSSICL